ncbi:adenylate/guanylate cyclase domain-containing protein [Saccharopolyspora taberi]|uniref:adenylate/guanylate cyclase domain-containing protein n=1 Tax=Saccharopolyspora taberi TaxID=60895 RepID=UPI0031D83906
MGEDRKRLGARLRTFARRVDGDPWLVALAEWVRLRLPGDAGYGDPLSVGAPGTPLSRRLTALAARQPSVLREVGFGALQVLQAHAGSQPADAADQEMAVLFTDLAGFSDWTLQVGDDVAVEMLRKVGIAVEPLVQRRGRVVKRLGDGLMAVFPYAADAVAAGLAAADAVEGVVVDGHRLRLRAGVHVGRPRELGEDYFGRDVNIAARVAAAAGPGEVLISNAVRDRLGDADLRLRRRIFFRAKGVPDDVQVFSVRT